MASTGRYLYGLIRATEDLDLGAIGLPFNDAPGRVFTVRVDALAAVVSELPPKQKILPLRKNLDPHHKVIREVMKTTTIIPMTFGHIAKSEVEIERALRRNRERIEAQLDRLAGKVEMSVKVKWDVENIFEYFTTIDPELRAYRDQLFGRANAPTQGEKLELGRMFEERRDQEREDQRERVTEMFRRCASEVKVNPAKSDAMVMDLAFLVPRDRVTAFEECVYQVAGTFPAQYVFDYSGPWAPFNFVDLDLRSAAA